MIVMITTQWYFFVKILAIPLKFAYEKREWMLINHSEHTQLYRTEMAEVISTKPSTPGWCRWWHDSHNFRMKNLYKQNRKCRWKRIQCINESKGVPKWQKLEGGQRFFANFLKTFVKNFWKILENDRDFPKNSWKLSKFSKSSWKFSKIVKKKARIFNYWVGVTPDPLPPLGTPLNESPLKIQCEISSGGNEVIICNFKKIYITEHQTHIGENFQVWHDSITINL